MKKKLFCLFMVLVFMSSTALVSASSYFKVVGDSMNPVLKDGDTIQVVSDTYKDGDMVVAQLQNGKKIVKRLMGDRLVSVGQGTNYPVSEVTILGAAEYVPMSMEELELYGFSWESVLAEGERIVEVVGGSSHSLALTNAGVVYAWGQGSSGELGNGTTTGTQATPVKVSDGTMGNSNVTAISAGLGYSLALKGGIVYAWGLEQYGRLGNGATTANKTTPVKVSDGEMGNSNVTAISAGDGHALALKDGKVYAWGWVQTGRLGNGVTETNQTTPVKVSDGEMGNSGVTAISAGDYSLALKDGSVYAWGEGMNGQLGIGTTVYAKYTPVKVSDGEMGNSSVTAISAGIKHALALKGGMVYAWGAGASGQLGNGESTDKTTPAKVSDGEMGNSGIAAISAGDVHSLALKGGMVYAWGGGASGQLGNGETANKTTPVKVSDGEMGNADVTAISAGNSHSLAVKGGEAYSWGFGGRGQLGNGTIPGAQVTPVKVSPHADWLKPVDITVIPGVIAPVSGAAPVTTAINTDQYTGTVSWSPNHNPFKGSTVYTATITLTAKAGYTLAGVAANTFTVAGATATHAADSGTVTAVFPVTAAETIAKAITIGTVAPVKDVVMANGANIAPQGAAGPVVTWSADGGASYGAASGTFTAGTVYKTKYVYTASTGYVFDSTIVENDITVTNLGSGTKTVELTDSNQTLTITVTWPATGVDPDIAAVNNAKTAAEDKNYSDMNQGAAKDEEAIENAIKAEAEAAVNNNSVTVTINKSSYTAPIAGTSANPSGTNGSYVFTITVSKGGQIQTTEQKTITITATAYTGVTAAQAVAAAKAVIVDGTANVAYGADQTAKTAAVQTYVNTLLTGEAAGVTAIVTYVSENNYSVAISKDGANDTKTIEMTINEGADPDITTVNDAKTAAEGKTFSDMSQGAAKDEEAIKNAIKAEAEAAVNDISVTVTINKITYTAPIAGTSANPGGTNGSYVFTITVSKGEQTQTTAEKTITITATAYNPIPTYSVSGNVKDSNNVDVSNAVVKLMFGQTQIGSTVQTNESGEFIITGVSNGTYNLVVQKGDIIVTTLITVSGGNYASGAITLPNGKTNSIVEIKSDNLPIVVGGLDAQFTAATSIEDNKGVTEDDKNVVASGGTVEIKFTAEKKAENAAPNASNITISATADRKTVGMFIDLSVVKTVTTSDGNPSTTTTALVELPYLIEVFIPLEEALQGKSDYVIYRYHGSGVDTITTTPNTDREEIELVENGKTLKLKVKKFSTYAISYASPVVPPIDNNNNSNNAGSGKVENKLGNDSVTIKNTDGGTIKESPNSTDTEKIFDITPNAGYVITDILVDGKSAGAAKEYIIKDLTKKVEIQAIFVKATAIPYYVDITGKEIFIKYSAVIDGIMKYIAPPEVKILFKDNVKNFKDISGHGAMQEIDFVTERELFVGTAPNVFSPDLSMTRSMFVSVLGRLHEASFGAIKESTSNPFTDTVHDSWYIKYVKWAYENGIISGVGGGKFEPGRAITMEEMAVILDNYLKFAKFVTPANHQYITFEDEENIAKWAKSSVQSIQKLGIIGGMGNYTFDPKGVATRAQAATVISRMINSVLN